MKLLRTLLLALALLLLLSPAHAADTPQDETARLEALYASLVESLYATEGIDGTLYAPSTYMYIMVFEGEDGEKVHELTVLHADVPDVIDADDLYALFIMAVSGESMTNEVAEAAVAALHERMYRNGYYSVVSGLDLEVSRGTAILRSSLTDSEEILTITQYPEDAPF